MIAHHRERGELDDFWLMKGGAIVGHDRVRPDAAADMAGAFYLVDREPPLLYRFAAQPITEISGPGGVVYRIVLRRLAGGPS